MDLRLSFYLHVYTAMDDSLGKIGTWENPNGIESDLTVGKFWM